MLHHEVEELRMHLSGLTNTFAMDEVLCTPLSIKLELLRSLIIVEQCQMVTFWNEELISCCIAFLFSIFGVKEYGWYTQHAYYYQDFSRALGMLVCEKQHFAFALSWLFLVSSIIFEIKACTTEAMV